LAWVNVALIDYKSRLRWGEKKLYCWPTGSSFEEELNPIGGIMTNPDTHDAPFLILKFRDYNQTPVVYPSMDVVCECLCVCSVCMCSLICGCMHTCVG